MTLSMVTHLPPPPRVGQTNACEDITFARFAKQVVKIIPEQECIPSTVVDVTETPRQSPLDRDSSRQRPPYREAPAQRDSHQGRDPSGQRPPDRETPHQDRPLPLQRPHQDRDPPPPPGQRPPPPRTERPPNRTETFTRTDAGQRPPGQRPPGLRWWAVINHLCPNLIILNFITLNLDVLCFEFVFKSLMELVFCLRASFMENGSAMIEIAWPRSGKWHFFILIRVIYILITLQHFPES